MLFSSSSSDEISIVSDNLIGLDVGETCFDFLLMLWNVNFFGLFIVTLLAYDTVVSSSSLSSDVSSGNRREKVFFGGVSGTNTWGFVGPEKETNFESMGTIMNHFE